MSETTKRKALERKQQDLRAIQELLSRHRVVEGLVQRQSMRNKDVVEQLVHRQHLAELRKKLDGMHPADIAYTLEALPLADRLFVWDLVKSDRDGDILLEVSDAVRESLIESMDSQELLAATEHLDADEIADLAPDLPEEVLQGVINALPVEEQVALRTAMASREGTVGAIMDFEEITVREDVTLEVVTRYLRRYEELPDHTDQIYVVDRARHLRGVLPISKLVVTDLEEMVGAAMNTEFVTLHPDDIAGDAAQAFERYDLVSAAVVGRDGKLIGRVTIDAVVDFIHEHHEARHLANVGLRESEDVFASVWDSVRNRWAWLAVNLVTAFIASRVIGAFEGSIAKLVALAALMPIVAGIGGNAGNQTITMIVRALALGQVEEAQVKKLFLKEAGVALLNGLIWGGVIGVAAYLLYDSVPLGIVMTAAMTMNLLLAATLGVGIPVLMMRLGRDPALGASVLITAFTDSGGFLIFLGLATIFLV